MSLSKEVIVMLKNHLDTKDELLKSRDLVINLLTETVKNQTAQISNLEQRIHELKTGCGEATA